MTMKRLHPLLVTALLLWMAVSIFVFAIVTLSPDGTFGKRIPAAILWLRENLHFFFNAPTTIS